MANTFIDPSSIPDFSSLFLQNYNNNTLPNKGGNVTKKPNSAVDSIASLDPTGILESLFGGSSKTRFKPFVNQQGQYVFTGPNNRNPVPLANVPGASLKPSPLYLRTSQQAQTLNDLLPYITNAINSQQLPTALSELQTSQITSPAYASLMTNLFNTYGPMLNDIGNQIQRSNQLSQSQTTNDILNGPGAQTVQSALDLQKKVDPEYFSGRSSTMDAINKLISSIDLSGGLSGTERNEIGQGLAREGAQRGTINAPSATDTVSNAMRYGQAGYQRQQQARSNLSDAITKASAFLPTAKSGIDAFQTATGRTSMTNPGQALFPGVNNSNNSSNFGLAGNLLGGFSNQQNTAMNIQANSKDWLDKFNQLTTGVGNIVSSVGKVAGGLAV